MRRKYINFLLLCIFLISAHSLSAQGGRYISFSVGPTFNSSFTFEDPNPWDFIPHIGFEARGSVALPVSLSSHLVFSLGHLMIGNRSKYDWPYYDPDLDTDNCGCPNTTRKKINNSSWTATTLTLSGRTKITESKKWMLEYGATVGILRKGVSKSWFEGMKDETYQEKLILELRDYPVSIDFGVGRIVSINEFYDLMLVLKVRQDITRVDSYDPGQYITNHGFVFNITFTKSQNENR